MVVRLDNGIVVGHDDLVTTNQRDDARAFRQIEILDFAPDDLGFALVAMCDRLDGLRRAAA